MKQVSLAAIGLSLCLLMCSCSSPDDDQAWQSVALPDISQQPVKLSVANVVNDRFERLSEAQVRGILSHAEELVKQHFDIEVELVLTDTLSIEQLFSTLNERVVQHRKSEIVDFAKPQDGMREKMQVSLYRTLESYSGIKQGVIDYAQPWLLDPETRHEDFISLSYALVDTLLARLDHWVSQTAEDGDPVVDEHPYHQWVWWDSLGYDALPYDVILTNQLVASAEYYGMDVHSSLRGGITAGTTTYSKRAKLGSYAYITVYPLINDSPLLTRLRTDSHYDDEQVVKYAAALLTHELGHLLLHLGHPFGKQACVMSPTVMLDYRRWYDSFDAQQCRVGSMPSMVPGAAIIEYNSNW